MDENNEKSRAKELIKSLEKTKGTTLKENINKKVSKEVLSEEAKKMKRLTNAENTNKNFREVNETYMINAPYGKLAGGQGKTVNTFIDTQQDSTTNKTPKPEPEGLMPEEALAVGIKRTLKSGVPINDFAFYDEVNYNLMKLGFPAKNAVDIKNHILKMIDE